MNQPKTITPEFLKHQVEQYGKERPHYQEMAEVLKDTLIRSCGGTFPEALIQSRAKTVSSFAEKCARKYVKYKDPVRQLTDLCGARVIVQTMDQVESVAAFIEANFIIHEKEKKETLLGEDKFGYRDLHYIVSLRADRIAALGIEPERHREIEACEIDSPQPVPRKAELQVRTWLQHAWADTLHDRIYKSPLPPSASIKRTGNLMAALMEQADHGLQEIARELDGCMAQYTACANREKTEHEIATLRLVLANEKETHKKPALALRLGQLLSSVGAYGEVVTLLDGMEQHPGGRQGDIEMELGYALCQTRQTQPGDPVYQRGCRLLESALTRLDQPQGAYALPPRRREAIVSRAHARLAWALEACDGEEARALRHWQHAHALAPENPYTLAGLIGQEIDCSGARETGAANASLLSSALATCRSHAVAGTELPYAYFHMGRLHHLRSENGEALGAYALGIRHILDGRHWLPGDLLAREIKWINRLHYGRELPAAARWIKTLLEMATGIGPPPGQRPDFRAVIVAGGAAGFPSAATDLCAPLIETVLTHVNGLVISGGTRSGVPGLVGDMAEKTKRAGTRRARVIGYVCHHVPGNAPEDDRYDELRRHGHGAFSEDQVIACWRDLREAGIHPSEVLVLGFGGGELSASEYRIAAGLGATVALIPLDSSRDSKDSAFRTLENELWNRLPNLFALPVDIATLRCLVTPAEQTFDTAVLDLMGRAFHERYVKENTRDLPKNMKPWNELDESFQRANIEQARYAANILKAHGYRVEKAPDNAAVKNPECEEVDIESMAEMEHGRWNAERLRDGWRYGKQKDPQKKIHHDLVPWTELPTDPEGVRKYDRNAARVFPVILAQANLKIRKDKPS